MLIEDIKFESTWISKDKTKVCIVKYTYESQVFKINPGVAVVGVKGMDMHLDIDGIIPFSLKMFLETFEPKLES